MTANSRSKWELSAAQGSAWIAIHAELGEVIARQRPGREGPEQVTIFGSVGLAFQGLAAGWLAYNAAH